jgi:N-formylglutamate amidohydrolase
MTDCFSFTRGDSPLLISIPHDGRALAPGMAERMTEAGLALPDTDWHVRQLYAFSEFLGAGVVAAKFSRYVVDLNRASTDEALYAGQLSTGLCPLDTFSGAAIYHEGQACDSAEQRQRVGTYWQPYHAKIRDELGNIRKRFGYALLWDAHSIPGEVPLLFDGVLPDLNIGTNDGESCDSRIEAAVVASAAASSYSVAVNGRFKGGFITRHFGKPDSNTHAIQLELTQRSYMDEHSRDYGEQDATRLTATLGDLLREYMASAERFLL